MNSRQDELPVILVSLPEQRLALVQGGEIKREFSISTAARGACERIGSHGTPRGWHQIRARIGAGCPRNTVFRGRRPTGEILTPELYARYPGRDWILTRILWLSGLEPGYNRLGPVDTFRRYIYIHGTPDMEPMGEPASHGCIRMRNADIEWLFERVPAGTRVLIRETGLDGMFREMLLKE